MSNEARECPVCRTKIPPAFPEGMCPKCMLSGNSAPPESIWADEPLPEPLPADSRAKRSTEPRDSEKSATAGKPRTADASGEAGKGVRKYRPPEPREVGQAIAGASQADRIFSGAAHSIYRTWDPYSGGVRFVAVFDCPESSAEASEPKFRAIARKRRALDHPGFVAVTDSGRVRPDLEPPGWIRCFLLYAPVDGDDLASRIEVGRVSDVENLFSRICALVASAHRKGVAAVDPWPDRIFLGRDDTVRLIATGFDELGEGEEPTAPAPDFAGAAEWTRDAPCLAPERRLGEAASMTTDVFALGVLLGELRGRLGRGGVTGASGPELPEFDPDEDDLDAVMFRAMERDPARRFQSVDALREAAEQVWGRHGSLIDSKAGRKERRWFRLGAG